MEMGDSTVPLIKGIFVNSHIKTLRNAKGEKAVAELERIYGRPIAFKNLENVPVREEVKILEIVLDILSEKPPAPEIRAFEAGRLHFRNFITTPFAKILTSAVPKTPEGYRQMLISSGYIARHVFKNTNFRSEPSEPNSLVSIMENNDYPLDHFKGLFYEWMVYWKLRDPSVTAEESAPREYKYTMRWQP
jgi:hypothetical protein